MGLVMAAHLNCRKTLLLWTLAALAAIAVTAAAAAAAGVAAQDNTADAPELFRLSFVGRSSLIITWNPVPEYFGIYRAVLAGNPPRTPEEGGDMGDLATTARKATFLGLDCGTGYDLTFSTSGLAADASGYQSETYRVTTESCGSSVPDLIDTDNPVLMRYCGRLPGCPLTAVILSGIGVAVVLVSFTRSALVAGVGAIGGMSLVTAVLDPSNPFIIIFIIAVSGAGVVVWKAMR